LRRLSRHQIAFALFGFLVVCSLIAASVGTVALDLMLDDDADPEEFAAGANADLIDELRGEIEDNPEDIRRMSLLAELLAQDGNLDESISWYERALEIDPTATDIRMSFALALKDGNKPVDAELQFLRIIEAEPENFEAHYYLAELYQFWEPPRVEEAAAHYTRVVEIAPSAFQAGLSLEQLTALGYATPAAAATPVGTPEATPVATPTEGMP